MESHPIGVSAVFPATWDKYDAYMGAVISLVKKGASEDEIAGYLHSVEQDSITLYTDEATRRDVAE